MKTRNISLQQDNKATESHKKGKKGQIRVP